jgi:hypothetical protein
LPPKVQYRSFVRIDILLALALEFPFKELTDLILETADECRPPSLIMNRVLKLAFAQAFPRSPVAGWAGTPETTTVVERPTNPTPPWQITVREPGWLAGVSGHTGFHRVNQYVNVGFGEIMSIAARPADKLGRGRWLGRHL